MTSTEVALPGQPQSRLDVVERLLVFREAAAANVRRAHALLLEVIENAEPLSEEYGYRARMDLECVYDRGRRFTRAGEIDYFLRQLDASLWDVLLEQSGVKTFMDSKARDEWFQKTSKADVLEFTRENVRDTFAHLFDERLEMFERGVVRVFQSLSWDYKTNSPVKFGKRIVTRHMLYGYGKDRGAYIDSSGVNKIDDLVRVMRVLDGKPEIEHENGAFRTLNAANWPGSGPCNLHGLISARGFKNGNAHLTFLRADLVDAMNRIIAKHYPAALPPAKESE